MSIQSDTYDWIKGLPVGTLFTSLDVPGHDPKERMRGTHERMGIKRALDYGLIALTGVTVPCAVNLLARQYRRLAD